MLPPHILLKHILTHMLSQYISQYIILLCSFCILVPDTPNFHWACITFLWHIFFNDDYFEYCVMIDFKQTSQACIYQIYNRQFDNCARLTNIKHILPNLFKTKDACISVKYITPGHLLDLLIPIFFIKCHIKCVIFVFIYTKTNKIFCEQ